MKFSVGDRVLLKRTGEEGFIVSFLSPQLMEVDVSGVRFPVYADEIDHPYLKWFTEPAARKVRKLAAADEPPAPEKQQPRRLAQGIYLSFLPQFEEQSSEDIITGFRIHLLNESPDPIRFRYEARDADTALIFVHQGELHAFGNLYLHPLSLEALNAQPRLNWSMGPSAAAGLPFEGVLRIRPAQLIRHIATMLEAGQPGFSILLRNDVELQVPDLPGSVRRTPGPGRGAGANVLHTAAESVLDLHIDPRNAEFAGIDARGLLEYQLRLFDKKFGAAVVAGLHDMTVIHGVGNGTLRDALHQKLASTPEVKSFRNDWSPLYGWGATRITF